MNASPSNIFGHRNVALRNRLIISNDSSSPGSHLGVLLPGQAYTAHHPALYYSSQVLMSIDADVLTIEPTYTSDDFGAFSDAEKLECLTADAASILKSVLALSQYKRVTWIAKSLGTLLVGAILERIPSHHKFVGLTPLLRVERLRHALLNNPRRTLMMIGSSDPQYDPDFLGILERKGKCQSLILDGANHSLEIAGDAISSIRFQEQIAARLLEFLSVPTKS